jgi:hypothetical protein
MKTAMRIFKVWFLFASMIGFSLFILEESSQVATFSVFMSSKSSDMTMMMRAAELMEVNNVLMNHINNWIGWTNPFGYFAYRQYVKAQSLYANVIYYQILSQQPELLEGKSIEIDFMPKQRINGILSNGRIQVITNVDQLIPLHIKGTVINGKIIQDSYDPRDSPIDSLHSDRDG